MFKNLLFFVFLFGITSVFAQKKEDIVDSLKNQKDIRSVMRKTFNIHILPDTIDKRHLFWALLPSLAFNPNTGISVGAISYLGKTFGNPANTNPSLFNMGGYVSFGGLPSFKFRQNVFTSNNRWNLLGNWQIGRTLAIDNGVGTGAISQSDAALVSNVFDNNASAFPITYTYIRINDRLLYKVARHFYVGAGLAFNVFANIDDNANRQPTRTHNYRYSVRNGFNPNGYSANGVLFALQYDSRDKPFRAFKGIYADVILRSNQTWLGSQHQAEQLKMEFRKYWSLSKKDPETVISYWYWANYLLNGSLPYLDLPGTGSDAYGRAGRGYVIGRFRGLSFVYNEAEFRFPISENKLFSGVAFFNEETANNQRNVKLFQYFEPGAGIGLRMLFNKYSRSNLCLDYGRGNYGAKGFFLGLNEVF